MHFLFHTPCGYSLSLLCYRGTFLMELARKRGGDWEILFTLS